MRVLCRLRGLDIDLRIGGTHQGRSRAIQGLILATGIAAVACRKRALSPSGAVAATLAGAAVHAGMGTRGSITMVSYFVSSSMLGRLQEQRQPVQRRGNRRDAVQVLANGGPPAVFSLLHALRPQTPDGFAVTAFYGSLAAAAADTWATEIGSRWGGQPRSIATGRRASSGESGAVTLAGLAASVVASLAISAAAVSGAENQRFRAISSATGGVAGSLTDSLLGALVQERRWCEYCSVRTELLVHTCGHRSHHLSGLRAVNNDVVNLVAVISGGLTAVALSQVLPKLTLRDGSRVELVTTLTSSRLPGRLGAP